MNKALSSHEDTTEGIGRGGLRAGAGRKPLPVNLKRKPITVTLPPEMLEKLKRQDLPVSRQVEIAVNKYLKVIKCQ
jgi:hypothetical protein